MVPAEPAPRVALVGVNGYGLWHLRELDRLRRRGSVQLVAVCDLQPPCPASRTLIAGAPFYSDLADLLDRERPHVTVVAAPIAEHEALARAALLAESDVLLEKPPVPGVAELDRLLCVEKASDRVVQVGFQSLGSGGLKALAHLVAEGTLGRITGIGAAGAWKRTKGYYARAPWAGRRTLDGRPVVDGALTNPFAHAVMTALQIADPDRTCARVDDVQLELWRANPIEADDTSCARILLRDRPPIVVAVTLCADEETAPYVVVHGSAGQAVFWYERDSLRVTTGHGTRTDRRYRRVGLLENLLAHRADPAHVALLAPLRATRAFVEVLQAVRDAPDPLAVPSAFVRTVGEGPMRHQMVTSVATAVDTAAQRLRLFSELDVPWATHLPARAVTEGGSRSAAPIQNAAMVSNGRRGRNGPV